MAFGGVGEPPANHSNVGHCSQYAVFTRLGERTRDKVTMTDQKHAPYELVSDRGRTIPITKIAVLKHLINYSYAHPILQRRARCVVKVCGQGV